MDLPAWKAGAPDGDYSVGPDYAPPRNRPNAPAFPRARFSSSL